MTDPQSGLGAKLGPALATLMAQAVLSTKQASLDADAQAQHNASWATITRSGDEAGAFMSLIHDAILASEAAPEVLKDWVHENLSGKNQMQTLLAGLNYQALGGSGIGTVFANTLSPIVKNLVGPSPQIDLPYPTLAELAARGLYNPDDARHDANGQGIPNGPFRQLVEGAYAVLTPDEAFTLFNRGVIGQARLNELLTRAGLAPDQQQEAQYLSATPLSADEAADLVNRGFLDEPGGEARARNEGMTVGDFLLKRQLHYQHIPLELVISLWRRGIITDAERDTLAQRTGLPDYELPLLSQAAVIPPSAPEVMKALIEGQTDMATAQKRYIEGGGDPTWFQTDFDTTGESPSPVELITLANRGIIPWTGAGPQVVSYEQGFKEGSWRNKWLPVFEGLKEYLPPPRTVTALLKSGAITTQEALSLLQKQGLTPQLAQAYTVEASGSKAGAAKELTLSQIESEYENGGLTAAQATSLLTKLNYSQADVASILATADAKRVNAERNRAIAAVRHAVLIGVSDDTTAGQALTTIGVSMEQTAALIRLWEVEKVFAIKRLTEAQVMKAHKLGVFTDQQAGDYLASLGYQVDDINVLMQIG